ncbi:MAG: hypothetical protein COA67_00640 [Lutibacter sp.]|nr:MAG: hypothetical protein COA67_00640 [Lutibacter sp.]
MDKDVVISLQKVSKSFNKELSLKSLLRIFTGKVSNNDIILSNISLNINKGDFVTIVGNNGAGKSTLLKLISGVLTPDSGNIYTNGEINAIHELTSGFNQELNGYENLELLATLQGVPKNEFLGKLESVISFSELSHSSLNKAIKYYSSGMKTRLAYAFNITFVKDILLLDEVLAVGDYNFIQKCIAQLKLLTKKGVTILLVTHNIQQVEELITKIYEIADTKIKRTSLEAYKLKMKKESRQFFSTHPNIKLHAITAKGENFKLKFQKGMLNGNNLPEIQLHQKEKVNFEFNISNSGKPINTRFYAALSTDTVIARYETVYYQLKNGEQMLSFDIDFPELIKGKYKLNFFIANMNLKEIILQIPFELNAFMKLEIKSLSPSAAYINININT